MNELLNEAKELLEEAREEIQNCYGRDIQLTDRILTFLIRFDSLKELVNLANETKKNNRCANAEKLDNGKCRGYQRSYSDDEPSDICKECEHMVFNE
ncbi:hypothetical protein F8154_05855 [Alkaliphilus pronyensis]|uniref:Uncharacterized protein n=1 Tax=Alkaliphilus pronyensis TaxID=1482732 RepID=A0A6I0FCI1_9FIRM|nr:hypothetical protein [Alkaliphilus pronyensis]KAB3535655.1 hypothetical protein F8154_05855 [Alkaliphilus pronyensis]